MRKFRKFKRVSPDNRPQHAWFETNMPNSVINPKHIRQPGYNEFGNWFLENCEGEWAYPGPTRILFSREEDRVKFILRWL